MTAPRDRVLDVHDRPPPATFLLLSLQHLFAMFGANVLVPILTGLDPSVALVTSGLGTLIYLAFTKWRLPAYLGSSFAFIGPIVAATQIGGTGGALVGACAAGAVYVAVALLIRAFGVRWLLAILPPIVVGPVIVVIGLGLASVAVGMAQNTAGGGEYSLPHFLLALATLGSIFLYSIVLRGFFTVVPILLGILTGYVLGVVFGMVDFGPVAAAPLLRMPDFHLLFSGMKEGVSAWAMILLVAPVALVTIAEHIGGQIVLSRVVGRNFIADPGLHRSVFGDGVATMVAGALGGPPATTYGENIGVLAVTRVFSVWVIGGAATLAIILGFVGKLSAFLSSIPTAVMGGVSIALFGVIASSGIRTLIEGKVDLGDKRNLLISSTILVIGIGGASLKFGDGGFVVSSMALSALMGVVLNAVLPGRGTGGDAEAILSSDHI
ncbi:solute carrier family 23 protein [Azospirillum isscasi]|uniref:Solute carrier family 23 protein n=1 Tax=Azospirillum isscasi TaxID=3053926 RepID=A0ABU0WL20_9PROT|nr:solute carrier family 23 protein [Azospirillum isscasi]MDQ2104875.1 solute carrier family 23 protein [Azospirillum isscasi]